LLIIMFVVLNQPFIEPFTYHLFNLDAKPENGHF